MQIGLVDTAKGIEADKEQLEQHLKVVEETAAAEKVCRHVHACMQCRVALVCASLSAAACCGFVHDATACSAPMCACDR